jgi:hypothetical protein
MPTSIVTYRNFGSWQLPAPFAVNEGDPAVSLTPVSLAGIPNGKYELNFTTVWTQPKNAFFAFDGIIQGVQLGAVAKESEGTGYPSVSNFRYLTDVTDGTLLITLIYEFPTQSGVASGSVDDIRIDWERRVEL